MTDFDISLLPAPPRSEETKHLTYHQHASGDFITEIVPGTNHCGIDERRGHFKFCVDINYLDGALDSHGFLLDNLAFQEYFDSLGPISLSCEQLSQNACNYFLSQLGDRIRFVTSINVRVYPFGDVFVEVSES